MTPGEQHLDYMIQEHQRYVDETRRNAVSLVGFSLAFLAVAMNAMGSLPWVCDKPVNIFVCATIILIVAISLSIWSLSSMSNKWQIKKIEKIIAMQKNNNFYDFRYQAPYEKGIDFITCFNESNQRIDNLEPKSMPIAMADRLVRLARKRVHTARWVRVAMWLYFTSLFIYSTAAFMYYCEWLAQTPI